MVRPSVNNVFGHNLPTLTRKPAGWLTKKEYAERAKISIARLGDVLNEGKIASKYMARYKQPSKQPVLIINWNKTAYDLIHNKPARFWPEDFEPNEAKEYKPISVDNKEAETFTDADVEIDVHSTAVVDIHSAKLAHEKLKIKKLQDSIRLENNELVQISEVEADNKQAGLELKAALNSAIRKMTPLLCGTSNPRKVEKILHNGLADALRTLLSMDGVGEEDVEF